MLINQRCAFGANGKAIVVPTFGIFGLEPNCRGFSEKLQIAFPFNTKKTGKISEKEFFADFGNFSFLNDFEPTLNFQNTVKPTVTEPTRKNALNTLTRAMKQITSQNEVIEDLNNMPFEKAKRRVTQRIALQDQITNDAGSI